MKTSDWTSPEIIAIGRKWASKGGAYDLASELSDYSADAAELLKPYDKQRDRPRTISLPTMMVDALQAILLSLPRQDGAPRLEESADAFLKRIGG